MPEITKIKTNVYEVKIGKKWFKVRATSMKALSDWTKIKENNVSDWRCAGMMSRSEIIDSQTLEIVG